MGSSQEDGAEEDGIMWLAGHSDFTQHVDANIPLHNDPVRTHCGGEVIDS